MGLAGLSKPSKQGFPQKPMATFLLFLFVKTQSTPDLWSPNLQAHWLCVCHAPDVVSPPGLVSPTLFPGASPSHRYPRSVSNLNSWPCLEIEQFLDEP